MSYRSWIILAARHGESDVPPCLILFWLWTSNRSNTSDMWACVQPSFHPSSFFTQPFPGEKGPPTSDIYTSRLLCQLPMFPTPIAVSHQQNPHSSTLTKVYPLGIKTWSSGIHVNPCQFMCFLDKIITENLYKRM